MELPNGLKVGDKCLVLEENNEYEIGKIRSISFYKRGGYYEAEVELRIAVGNFTQYDVLTLKEGKKYLEEQFHELALTLNEIDKLLGVN